ncbi:MAG: hypothetical protein JJE50_01270 [Actinomycetales bacterium]|nr:hypothetical protein [Actinomycetales bacterium]
MMKLLAAGQPLSLQVHPTGEQAEEGYRREVAVGIPLNDPTRNYRDSQHRASHRGDRQRESDPTVATVT